MIRVLVLLLAAQLTLTVYLYWPRDIQSRAPTVLVEELTRDAVQSIEVGDGKSTVTLTRNGDRWLMTGDLPADTVRVATLLTALMEGDPGYAIATSDSAAERFDVADSSFERRVELTGSGLTRGIYLGTAPTLRKVHARRAGENAIYVIDLNSHDAPTSEASWLDRGLAALKNVDQLRLEDQLFTLDGADSGALENLAEVLASLQVIGLASSDDETLAAEGDTMLQLTAGSNGHDTTLMLTASEGRYSLRTSAFDALFAISAYDAERLIEAAAAMGEPPNRKDTDEDVTNDSAAELPDS
jgi:hypothetical protein